MSIQPNPYPLRVEKNIMDKFKIIAKQNGRSVNKEIEQLMLSKIITHENEFGKINIDVPSQ